MSLFFPKALATIGERAPRPADDDDFWYQRQPFLNSSGALVTPDTAMRVAAVNRCVKIISEMIASLPLIIYEWTDDGGKQRAGQHPLYNVLKNRPNRYQTSFEWRELCQSHLLLRGNAYSQIIPGPRGVVDQLLPVHPDYVTPKINEQTGDVYYHIDPPKGQPYDVRDDMMFHLRGMSSHGLVGISPIQQAAQTVGLSLAMEDYGARFFSQSAKPTGILSAEAKLNPEQRKANKDAWQKANSGPQNWHNVAVLDGGLKWQTTGMSNEDAQFLEARRYQIADIARIFGVPLFLLHETEKSTSWGTGLEQQMIAFVTFVLRPWAIRWEQQINSDLILANRFYFAEFLFDALLRGDTAARQEFYAAMRQWGIFSTNDVLALENRNGIGPAGDTRLIPAGYTEVKPDGTRIAPTTAEPKAPPTPPKPPPEENARVAREERRVRMQLAAERAVRREIAAIRAALAEVGPEGIRAWAETYYKGRVGPLVGAIGMTPAAAAEYVLQSAADITAALENGGIEPMLDAWQENRATMLVNVALHWPESAGGGN